MRYPGPNPNNRILYLDDLDEIADRRYHEARETPTAERIARYLDTPYYDESGD